LGVKVLNEQARGRGQGVISLCLFLEGFGKLGQYPLSGAFSVELVYDNNWLGRSDSQSQQSNLLDWLWKISLD